MCVCVWGGGPHISSITRASPLVPNAMLYIYIYLFIEDLLLFRTTNEAPINTPSISLLQLSMKSPSLLFRLPPVAQVVALEGATPFVNIAEKCCTINLKDDSYDKT